MRVLAAKLGLWNRPLQRGETEYNLLTKESL